jgi:hypoxanthine phosphoribosyltransferase
MIDNPLDTPTERSKRMIQLSTYICAKIGKEVHSMRCGTDSLNAKERRCMIIASTLICDGIQQEFIRYRRLLEAKSLSPRDTKIAMSKLVKLIASFYGQINNIQVMIAAKTQPSKITIKTLLNTFDEIVTLVDDILETPDTYGLTHELLSSITNKDMRDKIAQVINDFKILFKTVPSSEAAQFNEAIKKADRLLKKFDVKSHGRTDDTQTPLNQVKLKRWENTSGD